MRTKLIAASVAAMLAIGIISPAVAHDGWYGSPEWQRREEWRRHQAWERERAWEHRRELERQRAIERERARYWNRRHYQDRYDVCYGKPRGMEGSMKRLRDC
jgi:hypothetical protein